MPEVLEEARRRGVDRTWPPPMTMSFSCSCPSASMDPNRTRGTCIPSPPRCVSACLPGSWRRGASGPTSWATLTRIKLALCPSSIALHDLDRDRAGRYAEVLDHLPDPPSTRTPLDTVPKWSYPDGAGFGLVPRHE